MKLYDWSDYASMEPLDRAKDLLEGMYRRDDARLKSGNLGEWQTEVNEVARILHYLIAHLEASKSAESVK